MSTALDVNTILILISNKINVLSVLFRITTSDYLFDILDLRLLITSLISSIYVFWLPFWDLQTFLLNQINQYIFKSLRKIWFDLLCFNATFISNISAISWRPVLVVDETGVSGENHRPWASKEHRTLQIIIHN
jgi:hypothetical protein